MYSLMDEADVASMRADVDDAYRTLSDPDRRAAYDRSLDGAASIYPTVVVPEAEGETSLSIGRVEAEADDWPDFSSPEPPVGEPAASAATPPPLPRAVAPPAAAAPAPDSDPADDASVVGADATAAQPATSGIAAAPREPLQRDTRQPEAARPVVGQLDPSPAVGAGAGSTQTDPPPDGGAATGSTEADPPLARVAGSDLTETEPSNSGSAEPATAEREAAGRDEVRPETTRAGISPSEVARPAQAQTVGSPAVPANASRIPPRPPRAARKPPRRFVPNLDMELNADTEFGGSLLRRLRESAGATLQDVADVTKIRRGYLRALEENDFDALPAAVYVRGFISEYARILGLDARLVAKSYMALYDRYKTGEGG
jgi:hypothetical protein